ncbi:asparagine synthase C-terminal domain-containing protein [Streptomyces sp. NPDC050610]|uniref:asparagine synthase C-terminal domain-containing protein n=1 Tax=Streptomyces sp. NPDC050610 TaxID=3157097 RepID=UPI00342E09E9
MGKQRSASGGTAPCLRLDVARNGRVETEGAPSVCLGDPDGAPGDPFAAWHWDGRRLTVRCDRYGLPKVFYAVTDSAVMLSTELSRLLDMGAPAAVDDDALAVFLRLGTFLAEDTPFRAVRALPPGARMEWTPVRAGEGLRWEQGHGPAQLHPDPRQITRGEAVDAGVELFRSAIAARLPADDYVLPLSGGRDSRHMLLELVRQGAPPRLTVTTGKFTSRDADVRLAPLVAAAVGVPHTYVPRGPSELRAELVTGRLQQHCSVEGPWMLPLCRYVRAHSGLTYDGFGGDILWQTPFHYRRPPRDRERTRSPAGAAGWLVEQYGLDPLLPRLIPSNRLRRWSRDRAEARIAAEFARHQGAAFPLASFLFWNRIRRAIGPHPLRLMGHGGLRVHLPYLDHDLFDLMAALPERVLADEGFHTEAIRRAYPRLAHLPFVEGPMRRGPRVAANRLLYLADLSFHALTRERGWWRSADGLLPKLLTGGGRPPSWRAVDTFAPFAVQLFHLEALVSDNGGRVSE